MEMASRWNSVTERGLALLLATCLLAALPIQPASAQEATQTLDPAVAAIAARIPNLIEEVHPAVVQILVSSYGPAADNPSSLLNEQLGTGSGVIVSSDGYIVTNAHVVQGARRVQVMLAPPRDIGTTPESIIKPRGEILGAQVIATDIETDLAVVKVYRDNLPTLEFADIDKVRQGQLVFAIGSPMGLGNSASMGIVSSTARQLDPNGTMVYVQTDASVNPGNSGGPLVDLEGRIVGLNSFILTQSGGAEGLSFAIPSHIVESIYLQIRNFGRVRRGTIGIAAQSIDPLMAQGLELGQDWGAIVSDVAPGGPAEKAGLAQGDVVLTLDGRPIENGRQLLVRIYGKSAGDKVQLGILRGAQRRELEAEVVERRADPRQFSDRVNPDDNAVEELGILGMDLDMELVNLMGGLREPNGVVVAATLFQIHSLNGGFMPGDVIHEINGKGVSNLDEIRRELGSLNRGDACVVQIERMGQLSYVTVEIGD
jgi:serine protease Do